MSDELNQETNEAALKYLEAMHAGLCPTCGVKVEEQKQVGRCVYGLPCWHRLFQGTAKPKEKKIHPYLREQAEREQKLKDKGES